ncbi:MAG: phenol hydroxylase subunit [Acidimicrobiia bacterium]
MGIDATSTNPGLDITRCFVQVVERRSDGFVDFRMAIGEPELFVEMMLGVQAFEQFCIACDAELLPTIPEGPAGVEATASTLHDDWLWTLRDATRQRFR